MNEDQANAYSKCFGYMLQAMREIAKMEPGSRGAYRKFADAQQAAKDSIEYCAKHIPDYEK